jgi:hypothetical protein
MLTAHRGHSQAPPIYQPSCQLPPCCYIYIFCFGRGCYYRPSTAAPPPPPPNTELPLAGPDQARSLRLSPSRSIYCRSSTRPTSPPYPAPLACDPHLASAAVPAARRDSASSHPSRAHFGLPRRTCVWARRTEQHSTQQHNNNTAAPRRTSGSVDQWWKVLPRRSRDQTQATRGDNVPPQGQLACPVLLPVC